MSDVQRPIALLFGGSGDEHEDSVKSFENVRDNLNSEVRYKLGSAYYIGLDGRAFAHSSMLSLASSQYSSSAHELSYSELAHQMKKSSEFVVSLLHGGLGEDGSFAGWARVHGILGSFGSVLADAVGTDKAVANELVQQRGSGILVPRFVELHRGDAIPTQSQHVWLERPVVAKPASLGASVGVHYIDRWGSTNSNRLIDRLLNATSRILIQEYIDGDEYSCGVLVRRGGPISLAPLNIVPSGKVFDHHSKLHGHPLVRPLANSHSTALQIQQASLQLFAILRCSKWARFDFMRSNGSLYFLEVNTLPGLMKQSLYPRMLGESNLSIRDLIATLRSEA